MADGKPIASSTEDARGNLPSIVPSGVAIFGRPNGNLDVYVPPTPVTIEMVTVHTNFVSGNLINFGYTTPNTNRPKTFGNIAHLWSVSANQIPWDRPPVASAPIELDDPVGDQNLMNISVTDSAYILGYAVGPQASGSAWSPYSNVVATTYIPPPGQPGAVFSTTAAIDFIGINSVAFQFAFPTGFSAGDSGAWAGLWKGLVVGTSSPPDWSTPIEMASDTGTWGLDAMQLLRGSDYTLGLFPTGFDHKTGFASRASTGSLASRLACSVSFKA